MDVLTWMIWVTKKAGQNESKCSVTVEIGSLLIQFARCDLRGAKEVGGKDTAM